WKLTRRDGRLFARGAADDKGAISAFLGAIAAYRQTSNHLPVNVKMVVEGEEEIGSRNLLRFFDTYRAKIRSDVIVVCDTEDVEVVPSARYAMEDGLSVYEQTWRRPAVTVIAQEASSIKGASNQVLPKASAIVSCRMVPDMDAGEVVRQLQAYLSADAPWGVE